MRVLPFLLPLLALAAPPPPLATILQPVANMHSQPSLEADVVSQAIYGTTVSIVELQETWHKVRTPDDYTGWMQASSLRVQPANDRRYASQGAVAEVRSLFCNLYREPSVTKHAPVLTVPFDTKLELVTGSGDDSRWLQVRLADDRPAWLQRGDVTMYPQPVTVAEMVVLSREFLGVPYLWGGTSSFGLDCSGFTQLLCRRRGVNLPRDAGPQAAWEGLTPVERAQLQPGDLLFFGQSPEKITHTGMYIGDGQFIHATTNGRPVVQISRLADDHWTGLLVASRRLK